MRINLEDRHAKTLREAVYRPPVRGTHVRGCRPRAGLREPDEAGRKPRRW